MKVLLVSVLVLSVVCAQIGAENTISGSQCRKNFPCDRHGQEYKWCWTSVNSERWDYCCTSACTTNNANFYWCYINDRSTEWRKCITQTRTSSVTINGGFSCRGNHPCGQHGNSYNWCYTDLTNDDDNWDLCCANGHACDTHNERYDWCYIGGTYDDRNWRKCAKPL